MSSPLTALSPLDGRYAAKTRALQDHFSEFALMRERVAIEVAWLAALAGDDSFKALAPFSPASVAELERAVAAFGLADAERIKAIEATTNHDVKAVEYWLRERFGGNAEIAAAAARPSSPTVAGEKAARAVNESSRARATSHAISIATRSRMRANSLK